MNNEMRITAEIKNRHDFIQKRVDSLQEIVDNKLPDEDDDQVAEERLLGCYRQEMFFLKNLYYGIAGQRI